MKRVLLLAALGAAVWLAGAAQAQQTAAARLEAALARVAGVEVLSVTLADARATGGERVARVRYVTREIDEFGYRAEALEMFRAAGLALLAGEIDVDVVALYSGVTAADWIERSAARADDLRPFAAGDLTRSDLLARLDTSGLGHSLPGHPPGGPV